MNVEEIPRDDVTLLELTKTIGQFGYYHGFKQPDTKVSCKLLRDGFEPQQRVALLKECALLAMFKHPKIIDFKGVVRGIPVILVHEDIHSPLDEYIANRRPSAAIIRKFALDVADALEFLATRQFVHWDVACRNLLLTTNMIPKLGNFGLEKTEVDQAMFGKYTQVSGRVVMRWPAPEVGSNEGTKRAKHVAEDIWGYGITLYEMFTQARIPYGGDTWRDDDTYLETVVEAMNGFLLPQPGHCPDELYDLMVDCCEVNPSQRPSFAAIKRRLLDIPELEMVQRVTEADMPIIEEHEEEEEEEEEEEQAAPGDAESHRVSSLSLSSTSSLSLSLSSSSFSSSLSSTMSSPNPPSDGRPLPVPATKPEAMARPLSGIGGGRGRGASRGRGRGRSRGPPLPSARKPALSMLGEDEEEEEEEQQQQPRHQQVEEIEEAGEAADKAALEQAAPTPAAAEQRAKSPSDQANKPPRPPPARKAASSKSKPNKPPPPANRGSKHKSAASSNLSRSSLGRLMSFNRVIKAPPEKERPVSTRGEPEKPVLETKERNMYIGDGVDGVPPEIDQEVLDFHEQVRAIRKGVNAAHPTNTGYLVGRINTSVELSAHRDKSCAVSIFVGLKGGEGIPPIVLECHLSSPVAHIIDTALEQALELLPRISVDRKDVVLKLRGRAEYLLHPGGEWLGHYVAAQHVANQDRELHLTLVEQSQMLRPFRRSIADDELETDPTRRLVCFRDLSSTASVSRESVQVLHTTVKRECERLLADVSASVKPLIQTVKALCFCLASVETPEVCGAVIGLEQASKSGVPARMATAVATVQAAISNLTQVFQSAINEVLFDTAVQQPAAVDDPGSELRVEKLDESFAVRAISLHRLPASWLSRFKSYKVRFGLYYGGTSLTRVVESPISVAGGSWFPSAAWPHEAWADSEVKIGRLPREGRVCCTLLGSASERGMGWEPLGWVAVRLFDHHGMLVTGEQLLGLWPESEPVTTGTCLSNILSAQAPVLMLAFKEFGGRVRYPSIGDDAQGSLATTKWKGQAVENLSGESETDTDSVVLDRTHYVALHAFQADHDDELSFEPGECIRVLQAPEDGGWFEGELNNRIGWFPAAYVQKVDGPALRPRSNVTVPKVDPATAKDDAAATRYFVVTHEYKAQYTDELVLKVGHDVEVLQQPEGGWWEGRSDSQVGWFPSSHVQPKPAPAIQTRPKSAVSQPSSTVIDETAAKFTARGKHAFSARHEDELSFGVDDVINILSQPTGGWWEGMIGGKVGWFPENFVTDVQAKPAAAAPKVNVSEAADPPQTETEEEPAAAATLYVVSHEYKAKFEDELTLTVGKKVNVTQQPDGGWWEGEVVDDGTSGWFPANHVTKDEPSAPSKTKKKLATRPRSAISHQPVDNQHQAAHLTAEVVHPYSAQNADELTFAVGDKVRVLQKPPGGWWQGSAHDVVGWFPSNHVRLNTTPMLPNQDASSNRGPLPPNVMAEVNQIISRDALSTLDASEKRFLWMVRAHLHHSTKALAKVLASMPPLRPPAVAHDAVRLVKSWETLHPVEALELLHWRLPDIDVRRAAVDWLFAITDDELLDFLPQLVQAIKFEVFHGSALALALLRRAMGNSRFLHQLFWLLAADLESPDYGRRCEVMIEALLGTCGTGQRDSIARQAQIIGSLKSIADEVRAAQQTDRKYLLRAKLTELSDHLPESFVLPLDVAASVTGLDVESCGTFNSNAAPLRLVFHNEERGAPPIRVIFKVGDDLRQDALVMQLIRLMDSLWRQEDLNCKMLTFSCTPTDRTSGFVEMVPDSVTLREIQTKYGVTGSFNDRILFEWLQLANPSPESWARAMANFTASCAGYCVATYVLGVCDRHNDNIMVSRDGHLFHIDFGRFLGNAQKFGSIRRDRVPFVLTSDMAFVINGGDKSSSNFQEFVDMSCRAFNILRHHANLLINLLALMVNSGIAGLQTPEDITYVREALMTDATDEEASTVFAKMIQSTLQSKAAKINFFFHNLGQRSSTSTAHCSNYLLSFCPEEATLEKDGRVTKVEITSFQKRHDATQTKYYIYVIEVQRENGTSKIFRRFSEFNELNTKLASTFHVDLPSFPGKIYVGRSHTRQVTEKRAKALDKYLQEIMAQPATVSESDLFYSFLHTTARDKHDKFTRADTGTDEAASMVEAPVIMGSRSSRAETDAITGAVELKLSYSAQLTTLVVTIMSAQNLSAHRPNGQCDPFAKAELLPAEPVRKQKTATIRGSLNPVFNESLEFTQIPPEVIASSTLRLSLQDRGIVGETAFLGGLELTLNDIDLSSNPTAWYPLGSL
eukprot:m.81801 g.81801  ORF g.81801 m.81801 type:complete len:2298 (+) comp14704_c1_seq2:319-7212(+)